MQSFPSEMNLNQYYTEKRYGDELIRKLTLKSPKQALDIGFGSGNLLRAAKRRWNDIGLIGIDIDYKNIANEERLREINAIQLNGFEPSLPEMVVDKFGTIDLLLSNPPYFSQKVDSKTKSILDAVGLLNCLSKNIKNVPAELVFLAQNLRLLNESGELGIILPAGLVSGERWRDVRYHLFSNYQITNVIQLPVKCFRKTDAQTFILTIKKKAPSLPTSITLSSINCNSDITISLFQAAHRADFDYYQNKKKTATSVQIKESNYQIFRGNKSFDDLKALSDYYLHTTSMAKTPQELNLEDRPHANCKNTMPGDIVVGRVGRRCLGRVNYVTNGSLPISDCVICIRPKNRKVGLEIFKALSSVQFKEYVQNVALGVGAKYITHQTLNQFLTGSYHELT